MRIVQNKFLPFGKRFHAINLFGVVFAKGVCDSSVVNHESIHTAQMKELAYVFFYLWYVVEWAVRLVQHRNSYTAYHNISFEREAHANQFDFTYLSVRRRYSFTKYICKNDKSQQQL